MKNQKKTGKAQEIHMDNRAEDFHVLSRQILRRANRNASRMDFLREVSKMIMKFSGCDALELWLKEEGQYLRCRTVLCRAGSYHFHVLPGLSFGQLTDFSHSKLETSLAELSWDLIRRRFDASSIVFTEKGSFWTNNVGNETCLQLENGKTGPGHHRSSEDDYQSIALIPLNLSNMNIGIMQIRCRKRDCFPKNEVELYEDMVEVLAVTLLNQAARAACRERIKELTCLYGIARAAERSESSLEEVLQNIVELLPPAWQYPEIASGRIILDGVSHTTPGFWDGPHKQAADIIVNGESRGVVEVIYSENKPELSEGPFLQEERKLIDTIGTQISMIIEQKEAEEEKILLEGQLRHADRLATIGQLAAGVAHELNEPLGNILGFAQLTEKNQKLSEQAKGDIEKIISASLHARDIINKLKLFARQSPPQKLHLDLNRLIEEGLTFLEARCTKAGIQMERQLSAGIPEITADKGQLHQVLVNLVVNSIQAMPSGGKLSIRTKAAPDYVSLIVQDTGIGMTQDIRKKIFLPFFTTKDVSEGTGLGLAVVEGIVSSHGGSIEVESEPGHGTCFEVRLPHDDPQNLINEELK